MKTHSSKKHKAGNPSARQVYPVQMGMCTMSRRISIPRVLHAGLITRFSGASAYVKSNATLKGGSVAYKHGALERIDCSTAQLVLGLGAGMHALSVSRSPKGIGTLLRQRSSPPADIRKAVTPLGANGIPLGITGIKEGGRPHFPRLSPGQCDSILTTVQQYAQTAQNAYTSAQADYAQADADMTQGYAIDPSGSLLITDLGVWTQLQALAAAGIAALTDISMQSNIAAQAAASALLFNNVSCGNLAQIQQAIDSASTAANNTSDMNNSWGTILLMGYFLGIQSIPKPSPPPPPSITASCVSIAFKEVFGIPYEMNVSLTEACTQSLLSTLQQYCGSPSIGNYITDITGVIAGVGAAIATGATGFGAVTGMLGAGMAALKADCQLIQQIIPEADNHGRGISLNFSAIPLLGSAAFAGFFAAEFFIAEEATLIAEAFTSGGTGDAIIDGFWITGN
jgi:hypothetical protein